MSQTTPHHTQLAFSRLWTLDQLAALSVEELTEVYEQGRVPDVAALNGKPASRMLTVVGPLGRDPLCALVRRLAASALFPWRGKSFLPLETSRGRGVNRVRLGGTVELFPFETRVDRSAIDGVPCLLLDYDLATNPWFVRRIRDELREISPGVYLGPAMWKTANAPVLVLYFAVDFNNLQ